MRILVVIAAYISLMCSFGWAAQLRDPIFGIQYDSDKVHFEVAPATITKDCPGLDNHHHSSATLWIYAHLKRDTTTFFIVQGPASDFGTAIRLVDGRCTVLDSDRFLVEGPHAMGTQSRSEKVDTEIVKAICRDILRRYERAFGGKEKFLHAVPPANESGLPTALKQALDCYRNDQCDLNQ